MTDHDQQLATKSDINEAIAASRKATKADINEAIAASRADIQQFMAATKADIKQVIAHMIRMEKRLDARINKVDAKLEDHTAAFNLFAGTVMDKFKDHDQRFDKTDQQINTLTNRFDGMEKRMEIVSDEQTVVGHQLSRANNRIDQIADHLGLKFASQTT